jgi:fatty acid-binding protein DegV
LEIKSMIKVFFDKLNHIMKSGRLTKVVKLSGLN